MVSDSWNDDSLQTTNLIMRRVAAGDLRGLKSLIKDQSMNINSIRDNDGFTPLHLSSQNGFTDITEYLLSLSSNPNSRANRGQTPLQLAASRGDLLTVKLLIASGAEINQPGFDGMTAIYAASLSNKPMIVDYLLRNGADPLIPSNTTLNAIEIAVKRGCIEVKAIFSSLSNEPARESEIEETYTIEKVRKAFSKSLYGLVGMDTFIDILTTDFFDFLNTNDSRIRLYWGDRATGKTEFGLRISGLRDGFPKLSIGDADAAYFSAPIDTVNFGQIADLSPPKSIIYIDDADLLFDPDCHLKDEREISAFRHSLNTAMIKKPLYWVLAGNFESVKTSDGLSQVSLERLFGRSLMHRIDYNDWQFPKWTLENLLRAVRFSSTRRGLTYEDQALLRITNHCLTNGAVICFDKIDQILFRRFGKKSSVLTESEVEKVIASFHGEK